MKNSSDTTGNRNRDLPACIAMPQPTAPPCAPEKIKTHILHSNKFFPENRDVYEVEKHCSAGQATDDSMTHIACWIPKATNTHPEYVIIIAFPLQRWLYERAATLNNTSIACLGLSLKYVLQILMTAKLTLHVPNFKPYVFVIHRLSQYTATLLFTGSHNTLPLFAWI
jgi:hypothetical protein